MPTRKVTIHQLEALKTAIRPWTLNEDILSNDTRKIINALLRRSTLFPYEISAVCKGLYYYSLNRPNADLSGLLRAKYFDLHLTVSAGYTSYELIFNHMRRNKPHPLLNTIENPSARELFLYLCHLSHVSMTPTDAYKFLIPICKAAQPLWLTR